MIRNFLDRGTAALLTVLPDRHDVIECISTASQFYILEAIKVVLNKPIDHFHLRLLLTLLPCICLKFFGQSNIHVHKHETNLEIISLGNTNNLNSIL